VTASITGAIIAAGAGRRLREGGFMAPKPLVPVAGVPLMASVLENFRAAGIRSIAIIVSEQGAECEAWARRRFPDLDLSFIVQTTASSLESFRRVLAASAGPRVLVSTVDAWCRPADFAGFARAAGRRPPEATVLAVTALVADEKPLWATLGPEGRISGLGGPGGDVVTAGLYLVSDRVRRAQPPPGLPRLREYLGWLWRQGEPLYGEMIENVVDVDRPEDVTLAEAMAAELASAGTVRREARAAPGQEVVE
jgi:NDP-sugar pyrophosphorylase family protein